MFSSKHNSNTTEKFPAVFSHFSYREKFSTHTKLSTKLIRISQKFSLLWKKLSICCVSVGKVQCEGDNFQDFSQSIKFSTLFSRIYSKNVLLIRTSFCVGIIECRFLGKLKIKEIDNHNNFNLLLSTAKTNFQNV